MDGLIKMLDMAGRTITALEQQNQQLLQRIVELESSGSGKGQ